MDNRSVSREDFFRALQGDGFRPPIAFTGMVKKSDNDPTSVLFTHDNCSNWVAIPGAMIASARLLGRTTCRDHTHERACVQLLEPQSDEARLLADAWRGGLVLSDPESAPISHCSCLVTLTLKDLDSGSTAPGVGYYTGRGGCQRNAFARAVNDAAATLGTRPGRGRIVHGPSYDCDVEPGGTISTSGGTLLGVPDQDGSVWSVSGEEFMDRLQAGRFRRPLVISGYVKASPSASEEVLISATGATDWIGIPGSMVEQVSVSRPNGALGNGPDAFVSIRLKEPTEADAQVLADLIGHYN